MSVSRYLIRLLSALALLTTGTMLRPQPRQAQATGLTGRVTHIVTGEPIVGALVSVGEQTALADDQGWYVLLMPPGVYTVHAQAPDYIGMSHSFLQVSQALTQVDLGMIPRDPDAEMSRLIDEKLMEQRAAPAGQMEAQLEPGDQLAVSNVTSVPRTIRLLVREDPRVMLSPPVEVITLDFEEYLKGVVAREMFPHWPREALRAQAVAARSYAAAKMGRHTSEGADLCSSVHCQAWTPVQFETTSQAVDDTRGIAATHGGRIIQAFYHSRCGGHTRNSEDVWGGFLPYARGVPSICGTTSRLGHGVGMCQHGARAMALAGATFQQILMHYYTGIALLVPQRGALSETSVSPLTGDRSTQFVFQARYRSDLQSLPAVANVIINGRAETMQRVAGDAATGWVYTFTTTLPAGEHSFRFSFDDGHGHTAIAPSSGAWMGPSVAATGAAPTNVLRPHITFGTAQDWQTGTLDGVQIVSDPTDRLTLAADRTQGTYSSTTLAPGAPFVAYGLLWQAETGGGSSVVIETRSSMDGTTWTAWRAVEGEVFVPGSQTHLSGPLVFGEARMVQFRARLTAGAGGLRPSLRHLRIAFMDTRVGPSAAEWDAPGVQAVGAPPVISRAQWGANETWMTWPPEHRDVRAIVVHHTATSDGGLDPAAVVRAIYRFHAIDRAWGDIGYNYLVDLAGRVYEGRSGGPGVVGRHVGPIYNAGTVGIGMIGNFQENPVPPAQFNTLTSLTAHQSNLHGINPLGETLLIDRVVPTILAHRDIAATLCPGQHLYARMGEIRADTLAKMAPPAPTVSLTWPPAGQRVRGVIAPTVNTGGIVTRMEYHVDGVLLASGASAFGWRWNTTQGSDGSRTLRVVVENSGGRAEASVAVQVDNTPPQGVVSAPAWTNAASVPITITSTDAVSMALSSGWTWEAEALPLQGPGKVEVVYDPAASSGRALEYLGGADWSVAHGPYTCDLPIGQSYQVVFRVRTDQFTSPAGLATVEVADGVAGLTYALLPIAGHDFASGGYQDVTLALNLAAQAPSCATTAVNRGLEFRTWFSGAGNLWLDRVQVFAGPQPLAGTLPWQTPAAEGLARPTVRLLDAAGNAANFVVVVGIDRTAPAWLQPDGSGFWAQDALAGLDVGRAAWSESHDGGATWGPWHALNVGRAMGVRDPALFHTAAPTGGHVRYRAVDQAGNESISPAIATGTAPGPDGLNRVFMPLIRR